MWLMENGQWMGTVTMAPLPATDRTVLRELARRVDEIAHMPEEENKKRLWTAHNMLDGKRPMVLCFPEDGWKELIPSDLYGPVYKTIIEEYTAHETREKTHILLSGKKLVIAQDAKFA